jgi:hypothetical protein
MIVQGERVLDPSRLRGRAAWRAATIAVVLTILGMPIDLVIARGIPGIPTWPDVAATAAALALLAILVARRRAAPRAIGHAIFLLDVAVIVAALWVTNRAYAESGRPWVPFQENKLGMMAVALLAPELWIGLVGIGAYSVAALAQMTSFSEEVRSHFALGEPWATVAFTLFALVLLASRLRQFALEREVARTHAEMRTTERFARVLLAVRDRSNTPLQTITLAVSVMRTKHPDLADTVALVDRALERLRDLDRRLWTQSNTVRWTSDDEAFDAGEVLEASSREGR